MRRTVEQAFADLGDYLVGWKHEGGKPDLRIFVYPPQWEPLMLEHFPAFARDYASSCPVALADVGQGFLAEIELEPGLEDDLATMDGPEPRLLFHDLGETARSYLRRLIAAPLDPPAFARVLVNTGALAPFVSYSALGNGLTAEQIAAPTVLAFPGEGDDRALSLLGLRADTNYRLPRI